MPELSPLLRVTRQVQAWMAPLPGTDASSMPCWLLDRGPNQRSLYGLAPDPLSPPRSEGAPSRFPKVAFHGSDMVVDPETGVAPVAASDIDSIRDAYGTIAPALAGNLADAATCLYTMSPDEHFIVGARTRCRRTFVAAGLSGHGFKLAPALGDALVDLAVRGRTDLPIDFLSPRRFTC